MKDSYLFYKDKLKGEYSTAFSEVELYVNAQGIDEPAKEERLLQLLDVFFTAQNERKPVKKIVGSDMKSFCDTFCSDMGIKNKILRLLDLLKFFAIIELIFAGIDLLSQDFSKVTFWTAVGEYDYGALFLAICLSVIISEITRILVSSLMFKRKKLNSTALKGIWYASAAVSLCACLWIVFFSPFGEISVPLWIVCAVCIVFLLAYFILNRDRKKRDGRKNVNMSEIMEDETSEMFAREMEKIFNSKNKRRRKKNKPELSIEEFLKVQEDECVKGEKSKWIYYIFPLVACAVATVLTHFEGFVDAVLFVVIQLAVQYAVMLGIWSIVKNGIKMRRSWIAAKRRELEENEE